MVQNAGLEDRIGVLRIMVQDPNTGAYTVSDSEAITTHILATAPPTGPRPDQAGWDAFVALYAESSVIKNQFMTCMSAR